MSHVFGSIALDHVEDLELDGWFRLTCAGENSYLVQIGSTVLTVEHDGTGDEGPWRVRVTKIKKGGVRPFTYWPKDLSVLREWQEEDSKPKAKRRRKARSK